MSVPKLADGTALFDRIVLENGVKVRVNQHWLSAHDARLIPEEQCGEYLQKGYEILDDSVLQIPSRDKRAKNLFLKQFFANP